MGEYCKSIKCPWYTDDVCKSPNDHTKKPDGTIECDFDRGVLPYTVQARKQNSYIKKLMIDIRELSNWVNEYAETLPEEDRVKMADAGEYLRILSILIDKSSPEILNEIQI